MSGDAELPAPRPRGRPRSATPSPGALAKRRGRALARAGAVRLRITAYRDDLTAAGLLRDWDAEASTREIERILDSVEVVIARRDAD